MTYDNWKSTNPADAEPEAELPCKFETFSGVCMICGAGIDEPCEVERERGKP